MGSQCSGVTASSVYTFLLVEPHKMGTFILLDLRNKDIQSKPGWYSLPAVLSS